MIRSILAVAAGYMAMALAVTAGSRTLTAAFPDYARAPETRVTPILPMILELVWAIPSAILGGYVTARIARRAQNRHVAVLAGIVIVLAIGFALIESGGPIPIWFRVLLPMVAAISVLIGGRLAPQKPSTAR